MMYILLAQALSISQSSFSEEPSKQTLIQWNKQKINNNRNSCDKRYLQQGSIKPSYLSNEKWKLPQINNLRSKADGSPSTKGRVKNQFSNSFLPTLNKY